ncbi:formate/nitrite transporter family protein [Halorarum salinum]|uniref:formate/nitrite transporter family protein n=1 Tax=Halorarum salinum TaxID=2743089 RepID=UPI001C528A43|nr:formate/nitrite transporter family protein [Halobaculum salinum]
MIAAAGLYHVITAAGEVFFFPFVTDSGPSAVLYGYWLPVFLGNTIGGVFLFALTNYAQTEQPRFHDVRVLTVHELLFSWRGGPEMLPSSTEEPDSGTD